MAFYQEMSIFHIHWYLDAYLSTCDQHSLKLTNFPACHKCLFWTILILYIKFQISIFEFPCAFGRQLKFATYAHTFYWAPFTTVYMNHLLIQRAIFSSKTTTGRAQCSSGYFRASKHISKLHSNTYRSVKLQAFSSLRFAIHNSFLFSESVFSRLQVKICALHRAKHLQANGIHMLFPNFQGSFLDDKLKLPTLFRRLAKGMFTRALLHAYSNPIVVNYLQTSFSDGLT